MSFLKYCLGNALLWNISGKDIHATFIPPSKIYSPRCKSLRNKTSQCPLHCKSLLWAQTDRSEVWSLTASTGELTAIRHNIDLLLHSWEGPEHFSNCVPLRPRRPTRSWGKPPCLACHIVWPGFFQAGACANVCSWHALGCARLLNVLTFHEYFSVCQHQARCIHTQSHTGISDVLAECRTLFPPDKYWEKLVPESGKSVPQPLSRHPTGLFFGFFGVFFFNPDVILLNS